MNPQPIQWKAGRGKLGMFAPLIGDWRAEADSQLGRVVCLRSLTRVLENSHIQLTADWQIGERRYLEIALIGVNRQGEVGFWSFTSDGRQSQGSLADVSEIHPQAVGFEAHMPAGLARMAYFPDPQQGFRWVVESRTQKGWRRFTEHHYLPR